jgi:outer membrane protein assembly factor BamB
VLNFKWARELGDIDGSPVLRDGRVYVGSALDGGTVFSLDASTGGDERTYPHADGQVKGFIFPDRNSPTGDLYFATNNFVWGVSDNGGNLDPKYSAVSLGGSVKPSPVLLVPGSSYLYVGGTDGRLYEIDVALGSVINSTQLGRRTGHRRSPSLDRGYQPNLIHGDGAGIFYAASKCRP